MKNLFNKYNQPNSLLVVSSYPERGKRYCGKVCAVGGFAKNSLDSLKKEIKSRGEGKKIIVLTVTTNGKGEIYQEDELLVIRCFKRNHPSSYFSLIKYILQFNQVKNILVEFEFASYGNTLTTGLFPFVLWLALALKKNITLVLHQVIFDLGQLSGHIGIKKQSLKSLIFANLLKSFYWLLCFPAENVIVLENEFKQRLSQIVFKKKIIIIPHGVDIKLKRISKIQARKKLGLNQNKKILLYFGYLTWYKGIDWLVKAIGNQKVKLIVAGGPSFTQKNKPHYQRFVKKVYQIAQKKNNVLITGFVKEKDINLYFSAADLVVLPYRVFMSSSGPLSLALSFGKPFILAQPLVKILTTQDFKQGLKEAGLTKKEISFHLNKNSFSQKLAKANLKKLAKFSRIMRQKRSFDNLAPKYFQALMAKKEPLLKEKVLPALRFSV